MKCPKCNSKNIGNYLYGYPDFNEKMQKKIDEGKIIIRGCCINGGEPLYHCNECKHDWGELEIKISPDEGETFEDWIDSLKSENKITDKN